MVHKINQMDKMDKMDKAKIYSASIGTQKQE